MAIDYVAMMQRESGDGGGHAAAKTAPVISYEAVKPKRLTKKKNSAQMKKRKTAEKTSMAKGKSKTGKKGKTKAQKQKANGKKLGRYSKLVASGMSKSDAKAKVWGTKAEKKPKSPKKASATAATRKAPKKKSGPKKSKKSGSKKKSSGKRSFVRQTRATVQRESGGGKIVVVQVPAARRAKSKTKSKGKSKKKGGKKGGSKKKTAMKKTPKGAMENPMTGVELFVGTFTGLLGFGTADVVDRLIATHSLTASTSGSTTSYTDTPPTASPAQGTKATYGSLFNATAVCAPMNLTRWAAGLGIAGVPIVIAHFVSAPVGRSAMQFFGFGAGMRIVGKGLIDLVALVSKNNATGMRLYGGEQRAQAIIANNGTTSTLPSQGTTGLGRTLGVGAAALAGHRTGCGCQACGVHSPAALAAAPQKAAGAGWPSYPTVAQAAPVAAQTPAQVPAANPDLNVGVRGIPSGFAPRRGSFRWGSDKAA